MPELLWDSGLIPAFILAVGLEYYLKIWVLFHRIDVVKGIPSGPIIPFHNLSAVSIRTNLLFVVVVRKKIDTRHEIEMFNFSLKCWRKLYIHIHFEYKINWFFIRDIEEFFFFPSEGRGTRLVVWWNVLLIKHEIIILI